MLSQRLRATSFVTCVAVLSAGCSFVGQEARIGVTFPEGWETSEVPATMYREAMQAAGIDRLGFPDQEVTAITVGWDPDAPSACGVFSGPERRGWGFLDWVPSGDVIAHTAAKPRRDPDQERRWSESDSEDVMLPSGPGSLLGSKRADGLSGMQYSVNGDGRSFVLACYAEKPPPDDWLSIAQTIEFLPTEE